MPPETHSRRRIWALLALGAGVLITAVVWPFVDAKWDHERFEECVAPLWAGFPPPRAGNKTAMEIQGEAYECATALGLDRFFDRKDIEVRRTSNQVTLNVTYTRPIRLFGHTAYRWRFEVLGRMCLVEGTRIATPERDIPIERVAVGDRVLSQGPGGLAVVRVSHVERHRLRGFLRLHLSAATVLEVTGQHPVSTARGWTPAAELTPGDVVHGRYRLLRVLSVEYVPSAVTVFDLEVEGTACFFANSALVHNKTY